MRGVAWGFVLLVAGCGGETQFEASHEGHEASRFTVADLTRFGVTVEAAGPGVVDRGIELPGEVRPNGDRTAHLAPRYPGIVREVRKHAGDQVRAGDVLAVIESDTLAAYELRTSIDGTVIDRHVAAGEAVGPDRPCFIVADLTTVWVEIAVYQQALAQVQPGQRVQIVSAYDAVAADGVVSFVTPVVDQATRTAAARVVLENPNGAWRPGVFVTATVLDPFEAAVAIPRTAVQTLAGETVVFVVAGDHFEPRKVTMGQVGRTRVEIAAGLLPEARYAESGAFLVKADLGKGEAAHED